METPNTQTRSIELSGKYELVTAKLVTGPNGFFLKNPQLAGFAVQFVGEEHYVVRLNMFPSQAYYLTKNRDSQSNYTLFSKVLRDREAGVVRFQNPVGSGKLSQETKAHLEIRFPLLGTSVFMNLYANS